MGCGCLQASNKVIPPTAYETNHNQRVCQQKKQVAPLKTSSQQKVSEKISDADKKQSSTKNQKACQKKQEEAKGQPSDTMDPQCKKKDQLISEVQIRKSNSSSLAKSNSREKGLTESRKQDNGEIDICNISLCLQTQKKTGANGPEGIFDRVSSISMNQHLSPIDELLRTREIVAQEIQQKQKESEIIIKKIVTQESEKQEEGEQKQFVEEHSHINLQTSIFTRVQIGETKESGWVPQNAEMKKKQQKKQYMFRKIDTQSSEEKDQKGGQLHEELQNSVIIRINERVVENNVENQKTRKLSKGGPQREVAFNMINTEIYQNQEERENIIWKTAGIKETKIIHTQRNLSAPKPTPIRGPELQENQQMLISKKKQFKNSNFDQAKQEIKRSKTLGRQNPMSIKKTSSKINV